MPIPSSLTTTSSNDVSCKLMEYIRMRATKSQQPKSMIHAKENNEARNPIRSNPVCRVPKTMVASRQRSDVSMHSLIQKKK